MKKAIRANFDASVSAYDAFERRTGRFRTLARLLAAEMSHPARGGINDLLDAGAGTGASTTVFDDHAQRTVALDISAEMLRANGSQYRVQGDFDSLPFHRDSFDGVAFTASLFLTPDPAAATREAARVLRSDGIVGAVAPLGWVDTEGVDVFADLERESRSPTGVDSVRTALEAEFDITTGVWRFATTATDLRLFHEIPAMGARLYPKLPPDERRAQVRQLFGDTERTLEQRWRWFVGQPN